MRTGLIHTVTYTLLRIPISVYFALQTLIQCLENHLTGDGVLSHPDFFGQTGMEKQSQCPFSLRFQVRFHTVRWSYSADWHADTGTIPDCMIQKCFNEYAETGELSRRSLHEQHLFGLLMAEHTPIHRLDLIMTDPQLHNPACQAIYFHKSTNMMEAEHWQH